TGEGGHHRREPNPRRERRGDRGTGGNGAQAVRYGAIYREYLLRAPALVADDAVIGAWSRILVHVADIEGGHPEAVRRATRAHPLGEGRIPNCAIWNDRQWLQTTG